MLLESQVSLPFGLPLPILNFITGNTSFSYSNALATTKGNVFGGKTTKGCTPFPPNIGTLGSALHMVSTGMNSCISMTSNSAYIDDLDELW